MRDKDFLAAFESGQLSEADFDHKAHVRAGINEHVEGAAIDGFDAFCLQNPDILSPCAFRAYYTGAELASPLARRVFVLPRKS